ncbi:MAG: c-type cytochrome [Balneolaceae bacterium]
MNRSNRVSLAVLLLTAVTLVSCRGQLSDSPPYHPQQNMYFQERFNSQEANPFFEDNRAMRLPVEGTVARGQLFDDVELHTGADEEGNFVEENPMEITTDFLYRGRDRYDIYCSVCHGGTGDGQGIIMTGQYGYVPAPTFHSDQLRERPDGYFYSVIHQGIRTMPSYSTQIPVEDRWAIVAYLRVLQESRNASEEEIREFDVDLAALREAHIREQEAEEAVEEMVNGREEPTAERGEQLFTQQGCQACHSTDGTQLIGPTVAGLYGSDRDFADGTTGIADEEYLRESMELPDEKIVDGFNNVMPPFAHLEDEELESLVYYIISLSEND